MPMTATLTLSFDVTVAHPAYAVKKGVYTNQLEVKLSRKNAVLWHDVIMRNDKNIPQKGGDRMLDLMVDWEAKDEAGEIALYITGLIENDLEAELSLTFVEGLAAEIRKLFSQGS